MPLLRPKNRWRNCVQTYINKCKITNRNEKVKVKVKVMFTLEQATKAQRGSRGIDVLFL